MTATIASPGPSSGVGTSSTCSDLRGSFSLVGQALEHVLLVLAHQHRAVGLRYVEASHGVELVGEDRVPDLVHTVSPGSSLAGACGESGCRMLPVE